MILFIVVNFDGGKYYFITTCKSPFCEQIRVNFLVIIGIYDNLRAFFIPIIYPVREVVSCMALCFPRNSFFAIFFAYWQEKRCD